MASMRRQRGSKASRGSKRFKGLQRLARIFETEDPEIGGAI